MLHLTKIFKTALILTFIAGGVILTKPQKTDAISALQSFEAQAKLAANWTGEKTDTARKAWQRLDASAKVKAKVSDVQHTARPIGHKLQSSVTVNTIPGAKTLTWIERYMSLPAFFLILVFGGVLAFMSVSGPSSRLGGRH